MSRRRLVIGWTLALLAAAGFARLGLWQSNRATEKAQRLDDAAHVLRQRDAKPLAIAADATRASSLDWSAGRGRFLATPALLLDNQQRDGRVGMRAYAVFAPDVGMPLLVDLGWLALGGDRALPRVDVPTQPVVLRGLLTPPPSAGLSMGAAMARQGDAFVLLRVEPKAIARALTQPALAPRVLRLDPALPIGYPRDLELFTNTLPPERHRGYALQWFGLSITTLVIAIVLTLRRNRA